MFHLDIKNGKIWIQRNQTDRQIADELVEMGVPKEDIVLGIQPSYAREHTGFGVAQQDKMQLQSRLKYLSARGRHCKVLWLSLWFPLTDRLSLEWASFGSDGISAEVELSQFSQRFERFDVADLIFFEVELSQVSQGF